MIKSFKDAETKSLWETGKSRRIPASVRTSALKKLLIVHWAAQVQDLAVPPGNRLEALKSDGAGQYSIRINDHYRICFVWQDGNAENVEIVDYH